MDFRALTADEIRCRVNTINDNGCTLLLYKDARCDTKILDETVGAENWQCRYYECKGNLFCSVGIKCGNEWVWKDNCGVESYAEKQKGEASDSFKRACFNWGIGRELYTAPRIWIPSKYVEIKDNKGKKTTYDNFFVEKIVVDCGKITHLAIRRAERQGRPEQRVFLMMSENKTC